MHIKNLAKNTHWHAGRTQSHSAADGHGLRRQRESSGRRRTDDRGRILQLSSTGGGANYRYMATLACLKDRRQEVHNYRQSEGRYIRYPLVAFPSRESSPRYIIPWSTLLAIFFTATRPPAGLIKIKVIRTYRLSRFDSFRLFLFLPETVS